MSYLLPCSLFGIIQMKRVQVHPVTPPPESPPRMGNGRSRRVPASMQHVEATVCFMEWRSFGCFNVRESMKNRVF